VDAGGLLRVGPESAGADPGPACYGTGVDATVTDAHVVLGRMDALLGGGMPLDTERAAAAVDRIARAIRLGRPQAAAGILRVANANMERAIRVVSVERGYDPRDFALMAFGGCGGLHACEMAEDLGIATVMVPEHAGALSALGRLMADAVRDYAAGELGSSDIEARFTLLERRARRESPGAAIERTADLRYRGQSYELNVPWQRASAHFHREHHKLYGYSHPGRKVEVVTIRVRVRAITPALLPPVSLSKKRQEPELRRVWTGGAWRRVPVWWRAQLNRASRPGPALVRDYGSTSLVPAGWSYRVDRSANLVLTHGGPAG
jgi:N-methylhydantoinase A/oxoprolinase/acetone carboxylase beta subunit